MEKKNWKKNDEKLLEEWSDHAKSYRWMHDRARMKFRKKNIWFQIPVIILSTFTGAANFAQEKIPDDFQSNYSLCVGFLNILAGIIATIASFLKVAELLESHRVSSISWGLYYHKVKTELQKEPIDRDYVIDFMKFAKNEYEKLIEQSPPLPHDIIVRFRNKVIGNGMSLPPIVGIFDNIKEKNEEMNDINKVLNIITNESNEEEQNNE